MNPPISHNSKLFPMLTDNHRSGAIIRYSMAVATTSMLFSFGCTARTTGDREQSRRAETSTPSATHAAISPKRRVASPEGSFDVKLPTGPNWQVLRGKIANDNDTFYVAVADIARGLQLTVMVLPGLKDATTLSSMKAEWEGGFLKSLLSRICG